VIDQWSALLDRPEFTLPDGQLEAVVGGKVVLVTGAGGTVGQALAQQILQGHPARLVVLDAHEASLVRLAALLETNRGGETEVQYVLADVRDRTKLDQTFRRCRAAVVFHLAAYKQVPLAESNIDQVLAVNVLGTANVLESAIAHGVSSFAFPSTDKAVHPHGVYGVTKRLVERYLSSPAITEAGLAIRVVRLVNILGSQGSVAEVFARQIELGEPIGITDVRMDRYWMTMAEATHLLLAAAARPASEGTYLIDVGDPVPLLETARRMYRRLRPDGGEPVIRTIGVRPGERLHEPLQYDDEIRRDTSTPGLYALEQPPSIVGADAWLKAILDLRRWLYDLSPAELRTWAFAAATNDSMPEFPRSEH
jgi:FlaA1/EpsC-like NDP-sugar epimerase